MKNKYASIMKHSIPSTIKNISLYLQVFFEKGKIKG